MNLLTTSAKRNLRIRADPELRERVNEKQRQRYAALSLEGKKTHRGKWKERQNKVNAEHKIKRKTDPTWREKKNKESLKFRKENPEKYKNSVRNATLKKKYGITLIEYKALLERQGGVCAICRKPNHLLGGKQQLHVDHNHKTGKVRELLCHTCNTTLGKVNESLDVLFALVAYVLKHKEK